MEKKNKKERQRLLDIMKDSIEQIVNTMDSSTKSRLKEIHNNIVIINLIQSIEDDDDDDDDDKNKKKNKIKIRQCYGMDELFNKIYSNFKELKISEYQIENAKDNIYELKKTIESIPLLSHIKHIEDLNINMKIECSKLILSYAKYDFFIVPRRYKRRQELLNKINTLNQGKINRCWRKIQ